MTRRNRQQLQPKTISTEVTKNTKPSFLLYLPLTAGGLILAYKIGANLGQDYVETVYKMSGEVAQRMGRNPGTVILFNVFLQVLVDVRRLPPVDRLNAHAEELTTKVKKKICSYAPRVLHTKYLQVPLLRQAEATTGETNMIIWTPFKFDIPLIILQRFLYCGLAAMVGGGSALAAVHVKDSGGKVETVNNQHYCNLFTGYCQLLGVFLYIVAHRSAQRNAKLMTFGHDSEVVSTAVTKNTRPSALLSLPLLGLIYVIAQKFGRPLGASLVDDGKVVTGVLAQVTGGNAMAAVIFNVGAQLLVNLTDIPGMKRINNAADHLVLIATDKVRKGIFRVVPRLQPRGEHFDALPATDEHLTVAWNTSKAEIARIVLSRFLYCSMVVIVGACAILLPEHQLNEGFDVFESADSKRYCNYFAILCGLTGFFAYWSAHKSDQRTAVVTEVVKEEVDTSSGYFYSPGS